jgi:putative acetyltransferase
MIVAEEPPHNVIDLLEESVRFIRSLYPEEHAHTYKLDELLAGRFFVARHDGLLMGCGAYVWRDVSEVELKHMFVLPASRGLGCGRSLLTAIEGTAATENVRRIVLETSQKQIAAVTLYKSFGYTVCAPYTEHHGEDIFMEKFLDDR